MRGVPGRLNPNRFGFAMPVTDPPFDHPPYYYRGIEVMGFSYQTDDDAAAEIVPEGLTLADSPAIAQLIFTNFHFSTLGAYTEAILGLNGGREPYGFPSSSATWCGSRSTRSFPRTPSGRRGSAFAPGSCGPAIS